MARGAGRVWGGSVVAWENEMRTERFDLAPCISSPRQGAYLQLELQLSAVARLLACDGDLAAQLQGHGAVQDA